MTDNTFKMTRDEYNLWKELEDYLGETIVTELPESATYQGTSPNGWETWIGTSGTRYSIYVGEWAI